MSGKMRMLSEQITALQQQLCVLAKEQYPVGCVVDVEISGAPVVTLRITGHNTAHWHEPGKIFGVNRITGKDRTFNPVHDIIKGKRS